MSDFPTCQFCGPPTSRSYIGQVTLYINMAHCPLGRFCPHDARSPQNSETHLSEVGLQAIDYIGFFIVSQNLPFGTELARVLKFHIRRNTSKTTSSWPSATQRPQFTHLVQEGGDTYYGKILSKRTGSHGRSHFFHRDLCSRPGSGPSSPIGSCCSSRDYSSIR